MLPTPIYGYKYPFQYVSMQFEWKIKFIGTLCVAGLENNLPSFDTANSERDPQSKKFQSFEFMYVTRYAIMKFPYPRTILEKHQR